MCNDQLLDCCPWSFIVMHHTCELKRAFVVTLSNLKRPPKFANGTSHNHDPVRTKFAMFASR
ncbi:hypothetical protein SCLCIDRAFT_671339 [Scleroderma citrinum Foug A]|uniref:Uncharacterized protein n=1 Tax=Scleroderma citrinum Foug A TaxID=1036808 RepID=A0A0C3E789_9AGAM|nr:hypothetical protein SCLCIDRAFT_671339 [Scleroderma citrinum Foug A]